MSHIQIRIAAEEKKKAQAVLSSMGLTLSGAIKIFLRKTIAEEKIPFQITAENLQPTCNTFEKRSIG